MIQQVLGNCEGVENINDDIIVHGKTAEKHDERLQKALERIQERGLTLSTEKCQFLFSFLCLTLILWDTGCQQGLPGLPKQSWRQ